MQDKLKPCPFISKVEVVTNGCWPWKGAKNKRGYGNYRSKSAHVESFQRFNGDIPHGMTVDHICNNPSCVNPEHLRLLNQYSNNMRGNSPTALNARKTVCINGHSLSGDNIIISKRKDGTRRKCRLCQPIYRERGNQRRQAALASVEGV